MTRRAARLARPTRRPSAASRARCPSRPTSSTSRRAWRARAVLFLLSFVRSFTCRPVSIVPPAGDRGGGPISTWCCRLALACLRVFRYAINNGATGAPLGEKTIPPSARHFDGEQTLNEYDVHNLYGLMESAATAAALADARGKRPCVIVCCSRSAAVCWARADRYVGRIERVACDGRARENP